MAERTARPLRVSVVGGGPGGLTFAALAAASGHDVTVHERRAEGTFGVGVTLWDDHLEDLRTRAPELVDRVLEHSQRWDGQEFVLGRHEPIRAEGSGYGTDRSELLRVLAAHAERQGTRLERGRQVHREEDLPDADLIVAADGAGSGLRTARAAEFGARTASDSNRFAWLELDEPLESFRYWFAPAARGWCWAYAYPHRPGASTVVVETTAETWAAEGFDRMPPAEALARLRRLFGGQLGDGRLHALPGADDRTFWSRFRLVTTTSWRAGRTVLLGDAAHTTHFSIGSGTRLAMEDAAVLAAALEAHPLDAALDLYSERRIAEVQSLVREAALSSRFFARLPEYIDRPPRDFVRLLERRRSTLLHRMPPGAYLALSRAKDRAAGRRLPY